MNESLTTTKQKKLFYEREIIFKFKLLNFSSVKTLQIKIKL